MEFVKCLLTSFDEENAMLELFTSCDTKYEDSPISPVDLCDDLQLQFPGLVLC